MIKQGRRIGGRALAGIVLAALMVAACTNVVQGSGNIVSESRDVSDFDKIELTGSGEVVITQDGSEGLTVTTDDNVMDYVSTEVRDGTLFLNVGNNATLVNITELLFEVSVDDLTGVSLDGSGHITGEDISTPRLEVGIDGSGEIILTGEASDVELYLGGSGTVDASDLASDTATALVEGSGSIDVWARDTLDIDVDGSGNVNYYGSAAVDFNVNGSGRVTDRGDK
jgi:hypothetical protein